MKFDTAAIHSGLNSGQWYGATAAPIFQCTSYSYETAQEIEDVFAGKAPGFVYSRISNPTNHILERRLTELENGIGGIVTSSGMAAISSTVLALVKTGDEILTTKGIFGGTVSFFNNLSRFGIKTIFADPVDNQSFADNINDRTRIIFIETIGNPSLVVPDFNSISQKAKQAKIPLVVDNTSASPYVLKPAQFGADIVIHSTSKFINGHGNAIGGAIIDTGNFDWKQSDFDQIKQLSERAGQMAFISYMRNLIYRDLGGCASPFNSFLVLQGLETIGARMSKHCDNALKIAEFLEKNEKISWVNYPGLASSVTYDNVNFYLRGLGGGLLTFGLDSKERCFKFIDNLRVGKIAANLGDVKTLIIHPASTIYSQFSQQQRHQLGISDGIIRVSVGIEDIDDIKNDFKQAINKAFEE